MIYRLVFLSEDKKIIICCLPPSKTSPLQKKMETGKQRPDLGGEFLIENLNL